MTTERSQRGFSLHIFMLTSAPDGPRTIEKSNWVGQGLMCPRASFASIKTRPEFDRPGVYILMGDDAESGLPRVYIGEGDPIKNRFEKHINNKDSWNTLFAFTSKDANLNKAHVQYLEARLVKLAQEAKNCQIDNQNTPGPPSFSEADKANTDTFLDELLLCLLPLGVRIFERPNVTASMITELTMTSKNITATGYEDNAGFVVLRNSEASLDENLSISQKDKLLRATLVNNGVLFKQQNKYVFTQDYVFTSPSSAAAFIAGCSINGRQAWTDKSGNTLKAIQERASTILS